MSRPSARKPWKHGVRWPVWVAALAFSTLPAGAQTVTPAIVPATTETTDESPTSSGPTTPSATTPKRSPALTPNVLDGLDALSFAGSPLDAPFVPDAFAAPLSQQRAGASAGPPDSGFSGLTPPSDGAAEALSRFDDVIRTTEAAPGFDAPAFSDAPVVPSPDAAPEVLAFPSQATENRPMGNLAQPGFLKTRRSIPIGGGRVRYGADVTGAVAYNNNVFGTPSQPQGDMIFALQPSIYLETGRKANVRFLWAPSVLKYARFKQFDSVNQTFLFSSRYRVTKLRLGLDASYVTQSGLFLNSQGQARQQSVFARIFAEYPLTRKIDLFVGAEASSTDSEPGGPQFRGSLKSTVDYRITRKTRLGVGLEIGQQRSDAGMTTYQAFLLRMLYNPTSRITFRGEGGIEYRQSTSSSGSSNASAAVLNLLLAYKATEKTQMSLRFFRNVSLDSFSPDEIQTLTGLEAALVWQLYKRARLEAGFLGAYAENSTLGGLSDGSYYFTQSSISLSYLLRDDVTVRLFNNLQQRLRDTQGANYMSNTTGMSMGMQF